MARLPRRPSTEYKSISYVLLNLYTFETSGVGVIFLSSFGAFGAFLQICVSLFVAHFIIS